MKVIACRWTNPDGSVHYALDTANPGHALSEHTFRVRTWPEQYPRLVEVEIRETQPGPRSELPTLIEGHPTEGA